MSERQTAQQGPVVMDWETFYSSEFTLNNMSTEEYIRDPRFEVIGVSIAIGNQPAQWYTGINIKPALDAIDWGQHSLLCFNTQFDGAILGWHYGHYPALYLDAMGMARYCGAAASGASLKAICEHLDVGAKGTYVENVKGKRAKDFTPQELYDYGQYCINDVNKTRDIYKILKPKFPNSEVLVQDRMIRMFVEPVLRFDQPVLETYHREVVEKKQKAMEELSQKLGTEDVQPILMSNKKFAELLRSFGVEPPVKISPRTGKETLAFAKTDPQFLELLEHENTVIQTAVGARLGVKSTIEETRTHGFMEVAKRGAWPVQYNYCGAHLRFSGGGNVNPQNLKRGGTLRDAVLPPPGHVIMAADSKQIQCRFVNYVAGQEDIVELFRMYDAGKGEDIYCVAASKIYNKQITPENKTERTVGKISELQLGFQGAEEAFKNMLFAQAGLHISLEDAKNVVRIYRQSHPKVRSLWYAADDALDALVNRQTFSLGKFGVLDGSQPEEGIGLPGGLFLKLPGLVKTMNDKGERRFVYMHKKKAKEIYGGAVIALCMQGLERIFMSSIMLRLWDKGLLTKFMTHDELVFVVPIGDVEEAKEIIHEEMTRTLPWAVDLPLACDIGWGENYGKAKS